MESAHVELSKRHTRGGSYTWSRPGRDDGVLLSISGRRAAKAGDGSNLDAHRRSAGAGRQVRILLSFQRPSRLLPGGDSSLKRCPGQPSAPERAAKYSAPRPLPTRKSAGGPLPGGGEQPPPQTRLCEG